MKTVNGEPGAAPASDTTLVPESTMRATASPDTAALTTAMAVAPGVYARNRMFAFFKNPEVRRARDRAALLRGVVRQLTGTHGPAVIVAFERTTDRCRLKYRVPAIRLERSLELDATEAACLGYLVGRAGSTVLATDEEAAAADRATVEAALLRLTA